MHHQSAIFTSLKALHTLFLEGMNLNLEELHAGEPRASILRMERAKRRKPRVSLLLLESSQTLMVSVFLCLFISLRPDLLENGVSPTIFMS